MPPTKTKREDIVELLKKRKTNSYIRNNVKGKPSWYYIQGIREEEERKGLKHQEPKFRRKAEKAPDDGLKELTTDQLDEIALRMYERAMGYDQATAEVNRLKNIVATQKNTIAVLEEDAEKTEDRKRRLKLAKQQGQLHGD